MLIEDSLPQIENPLFSMLSTKNIPIIFLNDNSQLTITIAQQTAIIDVGGTDDTSFIINNHQFRVNVDDFCGGFALDDPMVSQTEEIYVIVDVKVLEMFESFVERFCASVD